MPTSTQMHVSIGNLNWAGFILYLEVFPVWLMTCIASMGKFYVLYFSCTWVMTNEQTLYNKKNVKFGFFIST